MKGNYVLIDLARSIRRDRIFYWNPNSLGYTTDIFSAGEYTKEQALTACDSDLDKQTIMIEKKKAIKLYGGK